MGSKGSRLSDYRARYYSSDIGRWNAVDPLADDYSAIATYAYVANKPIIFIDPDGRRIVLPNVSQANALASDLNRIYETPME